MTNTLTRKQVADIAHEAGFPYEYETIGQLLWQVPAQHGNDEYVDACRVQHPAVIVVQPEPDTKPYRYFVGFYDEDEGWEKVKKACRMRKINVVNRKVL